MSRNNEMLPRYWYGYWRDGSGVLTTDESDGKTIGLFTTRKGLDDWIESGGLDYGEVGPGCAYYWRFVDLLVLWNEEDGITHYAIDPEEGEPTVNWPIGQLMYEQDAIEGRR